MRSRNEVPIISGRHQTLIKLGLGILLVSGVMALAFIGCGGSSSSNSGSSAVSEALGITDTDFGILGVVTATVALDSYGSSVALQPDGKILIGGRGTSFGLCRYTTAGVPDTTFGGGDGVLTTTINTGSTIKQVALQADGRIVAGGYSYNAGLYDFTLACYTTTGAADTAFGGGDGVVTNTIGDNSYGYAMVLEPDGHILLAGNATYGGNDCFALARYTITGTLDTTFGGGDGVVTTTIGVDSAIYGLARQPDGHIVATGYCDDGLDWYVALARYDENGVLDTTFSSDGVITQSISGVIGGGGYEESYSPVIQPDGKILICGYTYDGSSDYFGFLARYNTNGTPDTDFGGGDGVVTQTLPAYPDIEYYALGLQSDGKIVAAGAANNGTFETILARYTSSGALDTGFAGGDGIGIFKIGSSDMTFSLAIQPDGKIILGGSESDLADSRNHFFLLRIK